MRNLLLNMLILITGSIAYAQSTSIDILHMLEDDAGWEFRERYEDGRELWRKELEELDLFAVEVSKTVSYSPELIINILEDIEQYNEILTYDGTIECRLIERHDEGIAGYQYYRMPLMKNRYIVFEMHPAYTDSLGRIRHTWTLLSDPEPYREILEEWHGNEDPVLIPAGAGTWLFEQQDDGMWNVAYRLYMNPGGWIPGFLVNRASQHGITTLFEDVLIEAQRRTEAMEIEGWENYSVTRD